MALSTNQLIFVMPLISINFPANSIIFFKLLAFSHGDFLLLKMLYDVTLAPFFPDS